MATGSDIVKRLAQGADYCNAARAMMMAVGCLQTQRCNTNQCPVGVATQDPKRSRALNVPDKTERVYHYQHAAVAEATRLIASMGLHSPAEVTPHHLVRRVDHVNSRTYAELFEWLKPGELLTQPPASWAARLGASRPGLVQPRRRHQPPSSPAGADRDQGGRRMANVADTIVTALADLGVKQIWGVVGDALNPVTDAIRREDRLEWIGVRHEEVGAFAAGAQAQLTGTLGVCMGTVGPGSLHLLNGLYDAKKSHAPVLALCGQVPLAEVGSDFFQEVNNDAVFSDVAVFCRTLSSPGQLPGPARAGRTAGARTPPAWPCSRCPGDVGGARRDGATPHFVTERRPAVPDPDALRQAAAQIDAAGAVTLLVGHGARHARDEVLALADRLAAPMVLTLKAKEATRARQPVRGRPERADRQPGRPARV